MPLPSFRPVASALLGVTLLTSAAPLAAQRKAAEPPALVVVFTVDQLRGDYLQRFATQWQGGFRRFLTEGAVFPHGLQDHAITETAPGHSTVLSGRQPAHTGIVFNALGVPDTSVRLVGREGGTGASPFRFRGTTLVDWMRAADSGLQFLSVSGKDRGAILPVGRSRGPVFWYSGGRFVSSTWYMDALPAWLTSWEARNPEAALAGTRWTLLLPEASYAEPDNERYENGGRQVTFPHVMPADPAQVARQLPDFPWMDSLTLDVALEGAKALRLGRRGRPDLLAISLSATDYIGHAFGPDSREVHDHLLRLDRWMGWFLDSLRTTVGDRPLLVALTADHGVTSFPERTVAHGGDGGRIGMGALVRTINRELSPRTGDSVKLDENSGLIFADRERLKAVGVNPESLATAVLTRVWRLPGVADAWTPATLRGAAPTSVHARRWLRLLPPRFEWLVAAQAKPGYIWSDGGGSTTHGTTNPDDVIVPVVFLGPGIRPGLYPDTVATVDIAPTLARVLKVKPLEKLDGRALKRVLE